MSILLDRLTKTYDGHAVVRDVSLEIDDGELFVLLGPSGSGKSTVLRMIAGLADVDAGRVVLGGRDVTREPPQRREVGLVFQNYALFRHMTVGENIEFALRIRRVAAAERRRRRDQLLEMVGLGGFGERLPRQLSGGQQQRVALARALAHRPEVLLLDEPFGALDARIRSELRGTIRTIQRELNVTTIFVTHDQEEAFALADRIGVMNFGSLLEVGKPDELYLRPRTEFVATFLGTANLMLGETVPDGVRLGPVHFPLGTEAASATVARRVQVLFRPEDVAVKDTRDALEWPLLGRATVETVGFQGSFERLLLRLPGLDGVRPISPPVAFGRDHVLLEASRSQHQARRFPLRPGDPTWVGVRRVHALPNPGLALLLVGDDATESSAAVELGVEIARLAHARATLLRLGTEETTLRERVERDRERFSRTLPGLEVTWSIQTIARAIAESSARRHFDLTVVGTAGRELAGEALRILESTDSHLLLVPSPRPIPARALLCVALGEPGKEDVLFAGRFLRHLGGRATILNAIPRDAGTEERDRAERFLDAGIRTLELLGVKGESIVGSGPAARVIVDTLHRGNHDLLVLGAPLPGIEGKRNLEGVVSAVLSHTTDVSVMIVRPGPYNGGRQRVEARR